MNDELRTSVENLRALTPRLNAVAAEAAKTVEAVEHFLNDECSVGVSAYAALTQNHFNEAGTYLAYQRIGERFRVAVAELDQMGDIQSSRAWVDCSRAVRLETFPRLPALLAELSKAVDQQLQDTEDATETVRDILQALGKK